MKDAILELKSIMRGHRMGSKSAGNPKMSGSLADTITKALIYGKHAKSDTDLGIAGIAISLSDFTKQVKINGEKSNIKIDEKKFKRSGRKWKFKTRTTICRVGNKRFRRRRVLRILRRSRAKGRRMKK